MRKHFGLLILAVVIVAAVGWQWQQSRRPPLITVSGRVGGEKMGFLKNPDVQRLLNKRYGITIDAQKYGSVEMVMETPVGQQFLWPASEVNLEYYRARGGHLTQSHNVFHSPIVIYSWDVIVDKLQQRGFVDRQGEAYYVTDFAGLLKLVEEQTTWSALDLKQLYGTVKILSTDPTKSNSGNSFAGLLANMMNAGDVLSASDDERFEALLPRLTAFFSHMGFLEHSSGVLWDKFISQGAGAYPMIVGYENQLVEYSLAHPESRDLLLQKVRILYPKPTVWSSHPFIALDKDGERLLSALQGPDIQRLAWERHGFRSGLLGTRHATDMHGLGLPETIDAVIPMPHYAVMERILAGLDPARYSAR